MKHKQDRENYNMKKPRIWKNQDKEAQHHIHYIVYTSLQENNYIVKYIKYKPTYFIKIC